MLIPLKLVRDQPLQEQLYRQLQELITSGRLRPGTRMPSTRMLADQFSISRITVLLTYERLVAEGYLETQPAKGTFVAQPQAQPLAGSADPSASDSGYGHAARGADVSIDCADPSLFPVGRWRALMRNALDRLGVHAAAGHPAGCAALRSEVAAWLSASRGLAVAPHQVVLTSGRQQALHVAAHVARRPGAHTVVEDPCDPRAAAALASDAAALIRVPVDADGLRTDCLPSGDVALVHVTPEHQRPLGVSLGHGRRTALLDWAQRSDALVLEEDCVGELRYDKLGSRSLMSLDGDERVMLLGGFSTSLGPWLTTGYLVVPRRLIAATLAARQLLDDSGNWLEQAALAELLGSGSYARHVHRLGKAYASRRDALLGALRQHFGPQSTTWGGHAGLSLTWFPPGHAGSPAYLVSLARRCGLLAATLPGESRDKRSGRNGLLLGFGTLTEQLISIRIAQFATLALASSAQTALSAD